MNMLGLDEIREEYQNRTQRAPEEDMFQNGQRVARLPIKQETHHRGKWLPLVRQWHVNAIARNGQFDRLPQKTRPHVKEDKQTHRQRVTPDASQCFRM